MTYSNTKIVVTTGAVFFVVSVAAFFVFFSVLSKQEANFTSQNIEQARLKARHDSLTVLERTLEETNVERQKLLSRVLREEDVISFLALIESLGKEQGTVLVTNSLTVRPVNDTFEVLVVSVSVGGPYPSVMHVLKLLENLPYQVSIGKIQLWKEDSETGPVWKSSYELRVTKFKKNEV